MTDSVSPGRVLPTDTALTSLEAADGDPLEGPISVLHVDDDPEMLSLSQSMLERHGLSVTTQPTPGDALAYLDDTHVDCVVSDFDMPRDDGLDFLEAVRADYPELPFILFTGKGSEQIASRAISAGVSDYLQKGSDPSYYTVLANRIENLVDQYRSKLAVERTRTRFSKLIRHSTDVISIVSADARFEYLSPSAEHILGYAPEELVGEYIFDYAHPDDRAEAMEKFFEGVEDPDRQPTVEFRFKHGDGSWPVLESRGRNLLEDDTVNGFVVNSRDITALREHERKLERQNERLQAIRSVVSHDLQNPLSVARTSLEVARERPADGHLARADRALDRMETIIDDMLTLAELGERVADPAAVDLAAVAEAAWEMVDAPEAGLSVADTATLRADRSRLQQLLENLFRNSVDHGAATPDSQAREDASQEAGDPVSITVGTIAEDGFYVADDGPGVPPGSRDRVFESGYSTDPEGSGFGLAIVTQIAKAHGWTVAVADADGARFEITGVDRA